MDYYTSTWEGLEMYHTLNTSPYKAFRITEDEAFATPKTDDTRWVFETTNPEWEEFHLNAYDAALVTNSTNWS